MASSLDPSEPGRPVGATATEEPPPALGTEAGLRLAYAAHGGELFGFAVRALGDRGTAEEALQETFFRAWRASDRFDPGRSSLRTWLFSIMRHVAIDLVRRRASRWSLSSGEAEPEEDPAEDVIERAFAGWIVEAALHSISEDHRRAIVEAYFRDRPYGEIAAELGVPEGTVKSRVYHGLKALKASLLALGWNDED